MCIHNVRDSKYGKASLATVHVYTATRELPLHVIAFGYYSRLFVFVGLEWKIGNKVFCNNAAGGRDLQFHPVFRMQIK